MLKDWKFPRYHLKVPSVDMSFVDTYVVYIILNMSISFEGSLFGYVICGYLCSIILNMSSFEGSLFGYVICGYLCSIILNMSIKFPSLDMSFVDTCVV